jgi:hypothetical protein
MMDLNLLLSNVKYFFINLFSCFSEKETSGRRYFATSINECDVIMEDFETTYLFERDDYR